MLRSLFIGLLIIGMGAMSLAGCGKKAPSGLPQSAVSDSVDPARTKEIRAANRAQVDLALSLLKEGQQIDVREMVESQCVGTDSEYRLEKHEGRLQLHLSLVLSPDEQAVKAGKANALVQQIDGCAPVIESFWARYDVDFHWLLLDSADPRALTVRRKVKLHEGPGRSDALQFYSGDPEFCAMVLHEVGHHVGLPDEYEEAGTCRTAEFKATEHNPWSLMERAGTGDEVELFPRHFLTLLGPIFYPDPSPKSLRIKVLEDVKFLPDLFGRAVVEFKNESSENCSIAFSPFGSAQPVLPKDSEFSVALNQFNYFRYRDGILADEVTWHVTSSTPGTALIESLVCKIRDRDWHHASKLIAPQFELSL